MLLLKNDGKLVSSLYRASNSRQVIDAMAAGLERCGLIEYVVLIRQIPAPADPSLDIIASFHREGAARSVQRAPAEARSASPLVSSSPPKASKDRITTLWGEVSRLKDDLAAISLEVRTLSTWAEQFESESSTLPGFVAKDFSHTLLERQLEAIREHSVKLKAEIEESCEDIATKVQRLRLNCNRLEGLHLLHQQQAQDAINEARVEAAKLAEVLLQCQQILSQVQAVGAACERATALAQSTSSSSSTLPAPRYPPNVLQEIAGIKKRLDRAEELHQGHFTLIQQTGIFVRQVCSHLVDRIERVRTSHDSQLSQLALRLDKVENVPVAEQVDGEAELRTLSLHEALPDAGLGDAVSSTGSDVVVLEAGPS
eukprot:6462612-Amphidinium_carterae.2